MREELEQKLGAKYPKLFPLYEMRDGQKVPFHLECSDGWYDLIDVLCSNIQSHVDQRRISDEFKSVPDDEFEEEHQVKASQVKEKFGGLRFYIDNGDDYVYGAISVAESMSYRTCEDCGAKGSVRRGPWIRTLCDICDKGSKGK